VKPLTVTVCTLVAGSPSVEEMPAVLLTLPLKLVESAIGTVMLGNAVPAAMAEAGVYVQVTI
jgi:hypothetical protein